MRLCCRGLVYQAHLVECCRDLVYQTHLVECCRGCQLRIKSALI